MTGKAFKFCIVFGLSLVMIGELDFRLFSHDQRLTYEVDNDLYWRLRPNQRGFEWLANMSKKSPPISINSKGFRGAEIEDSNESIARVLAIGSSSAMGAGVEDEEVWTARLEQLLGTGDQKTVVFNAANPGWGPFQHAKFIERESRSLNVDAIIVMVSSGDLNFLPFTDIKLKEEYLKKSELKKKLANISPFITYSYRKLETLMIRFKPKILAMFENNNEVEDPVERARKSNQMLLEKIEKQKQYWSTMAELAMEYKKPLIFLLLKPDTRAVTDRIRLIISGITVTNPYTRIVEVDTTNRNKEELIIAGDGHPNAEYHQIIAETVLEPLQTFLNTSPSQSAMAK